MRPVHARPAGITDSSSPHRKWATARREEPAVAWRLRACPSPGPSGSRFPLRVMAKAANAVPLLLGSTTLWLSVLRFGTASAPKAVTAHLAAKWPETPLLLEARWVRAGHSAESGAEGGPAGLGAPRAPGGFSEPPLPRRSRRPGARPSEHHLRPCRAVRGAPQVRSPAVHTLPRPRFVKLRDFCLIRLEFINTYERKEKEEWVVECGVYCKHFSQCGQFS